MTALIRPYLTAASARLRSSYSFIITFSAYTKTAAATRYNIIDIMRERRIFYGDPFNEDS